MKIARLIDVLNAAIVYDVENRQELKTEFKEYKSDIEKEIEFVSKNRRYSEELIKVLFGEDIPISNEFYKKLAKIQSALGYNELSQKFMGLIWVESLRKITRDRQIKLLDILTETDSLDFWAMIHASPVFLSEFEIPPEYMKIWGMRIIDKIHRDMMSGPFYKGLENYGYNFPKSTYVIITDIIERSELSELEITFVSILLGALRAVSKKGSFDNQVMNQLDDKIKVKYQDVRICYYRSLVHTFGLNAIDIEELNAELDDLLQGGEREITESFLITSNCLRRKITEQSYIDFYLQWLHNHITKGLTNISRFHIIDSLWRLYNEVKSGSMVVNPSELDNLIISTQPMDLNEKGSWDTLQYYLVDRLKEDENSFYELLANIFEKYPESLDEIFLEDRLDYLLSDISKRDTSIFITKLLLKGKKLRRIGMKLYQVISTSKLSMGELIKANENQLYIILLELVRRPFLGDEMGRFLLEFESVIREQKDGLKKTFEDEMVRQAINYPGACLDKWKKINNPSDLLKRVIERADRYFKNRNEVLNLPANSFTFPEFYNALEKGTREYSSKIAKGAREKSIFAQLAKNVQIIYGDKWSFYSQGKVGEPSGFKKFEHSMEYPRLEVIDPEHMSLSRIRAAKLISDLENDL